jgi:hypothetical protein
MSKNANYAILKDLLDTQPAMLRIETTRAPLFNGLYRRFGGTSGVIANYMRLEYPIHTFWLAKISVPGVTQLKLAFLSDPRMSWLESALRQTKFTLVVNAETSNGEPTFSVNQAPSESGSIYSVVTMNQNTQLQAVAGPSAPTQTQKARTNKRQITRKPVDLPLQCRRV